MVNEQPGVRVFKPVNLWRSFYNVVSHCKISRCANVFIHRFWLAIDNLQYAYEFKKQWRVRFDISFIKKLMSNRFQYDIYILVKYNHIFSFNS